MNATYSPEDNKLRLYPLARLDAETYARVKAAGFKWAPKQELFVAPMWTPERADILVELCGEIGDEDTSLVDRAESRAERFADYSDKRADDANRAHESVKAISDNIPLGQPILVGHHSEKHARKDAERIESGMRRAVKMWETSQYWLDRAKGAIRNAKYKERPDVRARRIKGIEADLRKQEKNKAIAETYLKLWDNKGEPLPLEKALAIANTSHDGGIVLPDGTTDWSAWSALRDGKITPEYVQARRREGIPRQIARFDRWIEHYNNRLAYERAMMAESGGIAADQVKPEKGGACRCWCSPGYGRGWSYIRKVNKVSVSVEDNWGNGGANFTRTIPFDKLKALMSKAAVDQAKAEGRIHDGLTGFYLDEPVESKQEAAERVHKEALARHEQDASPFEAMKESLRAGVQTVSAPQLFPTPAELAARVVELANIKDGHTVLEPSAGTGSLLEPLFNADGTSWLMGNAGRLVAVEVNHALSQRLTAQYAGADIRCSDFLACNGELGTFDRIIMNPPFANGSDIAHIQHARHMLKPGGRLVAICANGPRQREKLMPEASEWYDLPPGSFKEAGTDVNAAIVVFETP